MAGIGTILPPPRSHSHIRNIHGAFHSQEKELLHAALPLGGLSRGARHSPQKQKVPAARGEEFEDHQQMLLENLSVCVTYKAIFNVTCKSVGARQPNGSHHIAVTACQKEGGDAQLSEGTRASPV